LTTNYSRIDSLRKGGLDRIPQVGIVHGGFNLVSKDKRPVVPGRVWQHLEYDGQYVVTRQMAAGFYQVDIRTIKNLTYKYR